MLKKILILTPAILLFFILILPLQAADPWPASSGTTIATYSEPSGAVWHESRDSLFIVEDNGWVRELDENGTTLNSWNVGGDLEGITVVNDTVYLGREYPQAIQEFDITSGLVVQTNDLSGVMPGNASYGLEALTYVDGVGFYAGSQYDGKIYVFNDSFVHTNTIATYYSADLSGLHYLEDADTLYAIFDSANRLVEMEIDGTLIARYNLPDSDAEEGITFIPNCPDAITKVFIAEDDGQVKKYANYPVDNISCSSGDDPDDDPEPDPEDDPDDDPEPDPDDDSPDDSNNDSNDGQNSSVNVENIAGTTDGNISIEYSDGETVEQNIFDVNTEKITKVKKYLATDKYIILHPHGKRIIFYENGEVLDNKKISKTTYKNRNLKIFTLQNKSWAVITLKNKDNEIKLKLLKIKSNKNKFGKEISKKLFVGKKVKVYKTKKNKKNMLQIRTVKRIVRLFKLNKDYKLIRVQ